MEDTRVMKIILLGAEETGKTSLVTALLYGYPITPPKPVLFGSYSKEMQVGAKPYKLNVCDATGAKEYAELLEMSFLDADIVVICVSVNDKTGLQQAERYTKNIKNTGLPVVLCMTKQDLGTVIDKEDVNAFVDRHGLSGVVECTTQDMRTIKAAFERIVVILENEKMNATRKYFYCC